MLYVLRWHFLEWSLIVMLGACIASPAAAEFTTFPQIQSSLDAYRLSVDVNNSRGLITGKTFDLFVIEDSGQWYIASAKSRSSCRLDSWGSRNTAFKSSLRLLNEMAYDATLSQIDGAARALVMNTAEIPFPSGRCLAKFRDDATEPRIVLLGESTPELGRGGVIISLQHTVSSRAIEVADVEDELFWKTLDAVVVSCKCMELMAIASGIAIWRDGGRNVRGVFVNPKGVITSARFLDTSGFVRKLRQLSDAEVGFLLVDTALQSKLDSELLLTQGVLRGEFWSRFVRQNPVLLFRDLN